MSEPLYYRTVSRLSRELEAGEISSEELVRTVIDRTRAVDGTVGAFVRFDEEDALARARASDERRARGEALGPLDGIPVGIKDLLAVEGQPLTCASRMLEKFISPYDATAVGRLKAAGAIPWGRLNMDEFAMGSSTEGSAVGITSNPWNTGHVPGGSSGGSAACVAAGEAPLALGTDTGGSIRQPAAFCGVVGMKPTYGLVSRYGLVAFASSLDQIGPLAHSVEDAALLLQTVAGHDERDSTSFRAEVPDYREEMERNRGPWRLGIPREYFGEGLDPEVGKAVRAAIEFYRGEGCEIIDVSLPHTGYAVGVYYIVATAEASSNLARFDGVRYTRRSAEATDAIDLYFKSRAEGFGAEVKRRIILGTYVLSSGYYDAYYLKAQKVRTLIRADFLKAYEQVDALLTPTTTAPAFRKGEKIDDPLEMYLSDIFTIGANLAGIPGISVPCGFSGAGLPVGLQILGKPFREAELFSIARRFEEAHDFHNRHPKL